MQKSMVVLGTALALFSVSSFGAAAKVLSAEEKVEINAPADKVWAKIQDFGNLGAWHPAAKKTEIVAGKDHQKGAKRVITLPDGGTISETLLDYSASKKTMSYKITAGVLPVSNYSSTLKVVANGADKSTVIWSASFQRKDPSATPAAGQDDATALSAIPGVFRGGLDNLKKITE